MIGYRDHRTDNEFVSLMFVDRTKKMRATPDFLSEFYVTCDVSCFALASAMLATYEVIGDFRSNLMGVDTAHRHRTRERLM